MEKSKKVTKKQFLLLAGILWIFAGTMVMKVGIESYSKIRTNIVYFFPIIILVFIVFYFKIFRKLVIKNLKRIGDLEEKDRKIMNFLDKKSYIIMACMMSGGMFIRKEFNLPMVFFFSFYTGLGAALFSAGVSYFCKMKREV